MNQFTCSVRAHSKHHLELKSEYPLIRESQKTSYQMDLYYFIPAQLNVTGKRIGVKRLIEDIKIYTRFTTPRMSLPALCDQNNNLSPIYRLRQLTEKQGTNTSDKRDAILYELQVLSNIFRSEIERTVELTGSEIGRLDQHKMCRKKTETFLSEIRMFLKEFRKLHEYFISPRITEFQRTAFAWADESISIITERSMNQLFSFVSKIKNPEPLQIEIEKIVNKENEYRKSMGYQYLYDEKIPHIGEHLAYRENILKKWSQSAMYMTREESRNYRRVGHIIAGIAAGLAMLFAVFVTIFAGRIFMPNTTPWILAIILSYIFKDRIKEILKDSFKKYLPRLTSDQLTLLYDTSVNKKVGTAKSFVDFSTANMAPANIIQIRNADSNPFYSILPEQDLIHYRRVIQMDSKKLDESHTRLDSTTEIIRFQIADWLREMDDPKDVLYRLENMKKVEIKGKRVYRVHMIMSLKKTRDPASEKLYHYCITLNKSGIIRVEKV